MVVEEGMRRSLFISKLPDVEEVAVNFIHKRMC